MRAPQKSMREYSRIGKLSGGASAALVRFEQRRLWPGAVADALRAYRRVLAKPGRWLELEPMECSWYDPLEFRDNLESALQALPRASRSELARIVAPLDAEFYRRTIPDPFWRPAIGQYANRWWRHRMTDG